MLSILHLLLIMRCIMSIVGGIAALIYSVPQELNNCFPIDLSTSGSVGLAACMSSSGASATIATLEQ